jgi:hypothetical protein
VLTGATSPPETSTTSWRGNSTPRPGGRQQGGPAAGEPGGGAGQRHLRLGHRSLPDTPVSGTTAGASDDTGAVRQRLLHRIGADAGQRHRAATWRTASRRRGGGLFVPRQWLRHGAQRGVYVASDCPAAPSGEHRRLPGSRQPQSQFPRRRSELLALSAGQRVYVYVDETSLTSGSSFTLEVNRCIAESEPNSRGGQRGDPRRGLRGDHAAGRRGLLHSRQP